MSSYCVSTILSNEDSELVLGRCYTLEMLGCEEESVDDGVRVKIYFNDSGSAEKAEEYLKEYDPRSPLLFYKVEEQDWNEQWRKSMKPAKLAPGFLVSPLWLPPDLHENDHWIKIEPKMAFGTGHHETTRLAAQAIISRKKWLCGKRLLDIGTGSGVLCFTADFCGAAACFGVENDMDCRENLAENYSQNIPGGQIDFIIGTTDCLDIQHFFDMIVMNMILTESVPLLYQTSQLIKNQGLLIWSGILSDENESAIRYAAEAGFELVSKKSENEWWCGTFQKK